MNISNALADAIRPRLHLLAAALEQDGHLPDGRGLSLDGSDLWTSDEDGNRVDLSPAAQAFINVYTPPALPASPNWGNDLLTDDEVIAQAAAIVDGLKAYRGLATPTAAQTTQAVKALAQVAIYLIHQRFPTL